MIVSLFVAKPMTLPFVKIFKMLDEDTESIDSLLGSVGKVVVGASDLKMGQGDVNIRGSNYRLNIKTKRGNIKRGETMLVVNYIKSEKHYIVEPYETID